jgi:hypothetical protein
MKLDILGLRIIGLALCIILFGYTRLLFIVGFTKYEEFPDPPVKEVAIGLFIALIGLGLIFLEG